MRAVCAGLAFWFAITVIGPTVPATLNQPTAASWSSR